MVKPISFAVRVYNVGFGDCFLLTFDYGPDAANQPLDSTGEPVRRRRILFDYGSTSRARTRLTMDKVAQQIVVDTDGKLDALVVTHRHRDHLSGFGARTGKAILDLRPDLVIRSWTEDPALAGDTGKPLTLGEAGAAMAAATGTADKNAGYLSMIDAGLQLAGSIHSRAAVAGRERTNLAQAAEDALTNAAAIDALNALSSNGVGEYLYAGRTRNRGYRTTRLESLLPGVKVWLLGPPRPSDWPTVATQASDSNEFWVGAHAQTGRVFAPPTAAVVKHLPPPGNARWIIDRLRNDEQRQLMTLVRWLDDVLNNTSVILLFEVGRHKLLFGGDAQIENWTWALRQAEGDPDLEKALAEVTVYKVGHHGSRNATPISLYEKWRRQDSEKLPFVAIMSTKAGVHGEGDRKVPRSTLEKALRERGRLVSTDINIHDWMEVSADVDAPEFAFQPAGIVFTPPKDRLDDADEQSIATG